MNNPSPDSHSECLKQLIELYKTYNEQAFRLESHIWQTALLFGIGSAVGLFSLVNKIGTTTNEAIIAAIFAINASLIWWRFSKRWWSIQHLKLDQMDEIEQCLIKKMMLRQGLTVCERDKEAKQQVKYMREKGNLRQRFFSLQYSIPPGIKAKESQKSNNYEYRGNQPVVKLLIVTNFILWSLFTVQIAIQSKTLPDLLVITVVVLVIFIDLYMWRKP
jgi:hypothetical protein